MRPPGAQIASAAAQSVVAGSATVTAPPPDGVTVTFHARFSPAVARSTEATAPLLTSNAASRSPPPPSGNSSLKRSSKVNGFAPCPSGRPRSSAVSGSGSPIPGAAAGSVPSWRRSAAIPDAFETMAAPFATRLSATAAIPASALAPRGTSIENTRAALPDPDA